MILKFPVLTDILIFPGECSSKSNWISASCGSPSECRDLHSHLLCRHGSDIAFGSARTSSHSCEPFGGTICVGLASGTRPKAQTILVSDAVCCHACSATHDSER